MLQTFPQIDIDDSNIINSDELLHEIGIDGSLLDEESLSQIQIAELHKFVLTA